MNKFLIFLLLIGLGCKKIDPPSNEFIDREFWADAITVAKVDFISKQGNIMNFNMHVVATKNAETHHKYPNSSFFPVSIGFPITIDSISKNETNNNLAFQTIILIDETPTGWGPQNTRKFFDALNRMNRLCKNENNQTFGIGFYARDEYFGETPVNYFTNENNEFFNHTEQEIMAFISKFYTSLGIPLSSSLYDAMNSALDKLIANPISQNQSITVIMGSNDDGLSSITYTNFLQKCLDYNIKVNLIASDVPSYNYFQLALSTGGFISDNSGTSISGNHSSRTAESVVFHMYDLLAQNYKEYIIHCKATRTTSWVAGTIFNSYLEANYTEEITGNYFEDDLYDDLEINQKLPISIKVQ